MNILSASPTIVTADIEAARAFYLNHFDAHIHFDCGWYAVLRLGSSEPAPEICLMAPRDGMAVCSGGVFLNIRVDGVDAWHQKCCAAGLTPVIPLEDHPWGDRGFGIVDPSQVVVYCYEPIPPAPEFQQYFTG